MFKTYLGVFAILMFAPFNQKIFAQHDKTAPQPTMVQTTVSPLAGAALPANAKRMKNPADAAMMAQAMKPLLDAAGVFLVEPEFLVWERPTYQRKQATKLMVQMAQSLEASGYVYQQARPLDLESGQIIVMTAAQKGHPGLGGCWMINDQWLSLTWGKLQVQGRPSESVQNPAFTGDTPQNQSTRIGAIEAPPVWGATQFMQPIRPITLSAAIPGALHGVYLGTGRNSYGFVGPLFAEVGFGKDFLTFYRDGRVTDSRNPEGMDVYNPDAEKAAFPAHGRYRVTGNRVEIIWSDGKMAAGVLKKNGVLVASGNYTDNEYVPLPVLDNITLDGTYLFRATPYIQSYSISFARNGRFRDSGLLSRTGLTGTYKYSGLHWSTDPPRGTGSYRIRNNTLYLDYDNKIRLSVEILLEPTDKGKAAFSSITLGGFKFPRQ